MRKTLAAVAFAAAVLCTAFSTGCVRSETVDLPREYTITRALYELTEISYPDEYMNPVASEEGVTLKLMGDGVTISADIPLRLAGERIDLSKRDLTPDPDDGLYYTFYLSEDGIDGLYCRIISWESEPHPHNTYSYGGWFTIDRGKTAGEWIFEWNLTDRATEKTISKGYFEGPFEKI